MDNTDKYCFLDKQSPDKKKSLLPITTTNYNCVRCFLQLL